MEKSILYKLLITIAASFALGVVIVIVTESYILSERAGFDTYGVIGLIFSVVFAGVAIVSLITAISLGRKINKEKKEGVRISEETMQRYNKFKEDVLLQLINFDKSKTLRIGDRNIKEKGVKLVDGLFEINNNKMGICTFTGSFTDEIAGNGLDEFLNNIAAEIADHTFDRVYLVFEELSGVNEKFEKAVAKLKKLYKKEISDKISIICGTPDEITDTINQKIGYQE